jgi:HK97 family phage prohead protease
MDVDVTDHTATTTPDVTAPPAVLVRSYDVEIQAGDGRTLDARIVPYDVPTVVADPPAMRPYREVFLHGAFERQIAAPGRVKVWLNFEHEQGIRGIVGHGLELQERTDGLYGSFRVHENPDGDKALQLVDQELLTGLSLEFAALRSRDVNGITQRLRAHVDKVSLCRSPAYPGAEVLAVRDEPAALELRGEPELDPELASRIERLGIPTMQRAVTKAAWDGSPARFTDAEYERSTLFCRPGDGPVKDRCSLPVLEPDGTLNANALGAAAGALAGARGGLRNVPAGMRATAAAKLLRYYGQAKMDPPPSLRALARS